MKKGDPVKILLKDGSHINSTCLGMYGGIIYIGSPYETLLSGVYWELLNKGLIA